MIGVTVTLAFFWGRLWVMRWGCRRRGCRGRRSKGGHRGRGRVRPGGSSPRAEPLDRRRGHATPSQPDPSGHQLNWEEIGPGAAWPGAALAADELTCASTSARSCPGLVAYPALRAQEHDQVRLIRALMSPSSAGSLAAN